MGVARDVVRRRIDPGGTKEITVVTEGGNRILVEVPGVEDPEALKKLIGQTARLEFKLVDLSANPAGRPAGPRAAGQPGLADGRRHRLHGGQAPRDGLRRPADRRQAGLRPGRPPRHQHQVQHRRRPPLRARDAGECRQAVRDHPRRQDPVGAEYQRADPRRPGADHAAASPSRARTTSPSASRRASCR